MSTMACAHGGQHEVTVENLRGVDCNNPCCYKQNLQNLKGECLWALAHKGKPERMVIGGSDRATYYAILRRD